jgi:hypothetical protein
VACLILGDLPNWCDICWHDKRNRNADECLAVFTKWAGQHAGEVRVSRVPVGVSRLQVVMSRLPGEGHKMGDAGFTVVWGRSVVEPTRGHVRETPEAGVVGMAICGALLIDDLDPDLAAGEFDKCSTCLELLE